MPYFVVSFLSINQTKGNTKYLEIWIVFVTGFEEYHRRSHELQSEHNINGY